MEKPLWNFTDNRASFASSTSDKFNTLYFPLANHYPIMSSLSPNLHGDLKTNFNSFLLEPAGRLALSNSKSSRNFWIHTPPALAHKGWAWSACGVSKLGEITKYDTSKLEAGLLWHKITRRNKKIGLEAAITSFIPASNEPVEIMRVEIANISNKRVKFIPTAAIPLFARSAHNLHDHRQVTSLFVRTQKNKFGVTVTPALSFDENGHRQNFTSYFVFGLDKNGSGPRHIFPAQEEFCGEGSDLEAPEAITKNLLPDKKLKADGREPMGALRFKTITLKPKQKCSYIIILGIAENKKNTASLLKKFASPGKIEKSLELTKSYWQNLSGANSFNTGDNALDNWLGWVSIQPELRKIFGCSFLPDFDYGKGGRGWRDLWQDCLYLVLSSPENVRPFLINNFKGVRVDGSNATIIGAKPGEFIADRNNIPRTWMDHGAWPLVTTLLYIHQTEDLHILLEEVTYFRDHLLARASQKDWDWKPEYGNRLKTKTNEIYTGSILEHILVENLVQFFNVGAHNHIRLEGADWNDGLDMAKEHGESVTFSAMYAKNLSDIACLIKKLNRKDIVIFKELSILLDSLGANPADYADIGKKRKILEDYFNAVKCEISGEKISLPAEDLAKDLEKKAGWIRQHIRQNEWLKEGFFNGYYDNAKKRLEGKINGILRMTLPAQVFAVMSDAATEEQVKIIFKNAKKYLQDKKLKGFRLNTDFKEEQLNLGRAFSFVYGEKENGAFFNHMNVMFAYALYERGFAREGYEVIDSIYRMAVNTRTSKIYPCLPEYFNAAGRGMYCYLTGSASWFMLTVLTQIFGIKGNYGNLGIEPKLIAKQFSRKNFLSVNTSFAGKKITVKFINLKKKNYGKYVIGRVIFNGRVIEENAASPRITINRNEFLKLANRPLNIIEIFLS